MSTFQITKFEIFILLLLLLLLSLLLLLLYQYISAKRVHIYTFLYSEWARKKAETWNEHLLNIRNGNFQVK